MARALIVGCGCHGRDLGRELSDRGWQVRGTSRTDEGVAEIDAAGIEGVLADPDRPGTILDLVGDVAVVVWLLATAEAEPEVIAAIHGPRLESLMEKLVDTPVRGFIYESVGSVQASRLEQGTAIVQRASDTWRIPASFIDTPRASEGWAVKVADLSDSILERR